MNNQDKLLNVSVDCVIFGYQDNQLNVLLIEQEKFNAQHIPLSALPGDHIIKGEDLDMAANRVLKGLTGVDGVYMKQFKAFGNPERTKDEKDKIWLNAVRENPDAHIITIGYYALTRMDKISLTPSSFAKRAYWADVKKIPNLAFDHNEIFEEALQHLKKDAESFYISCELLPEKFTLSQLQSLYEAILDKKLDKRNFRKNAKKMKSLICLNEKQKGVSHKPALLYAIDSKNV